MLDVAVGVVVNRSGQILISRRAQDAHQAGLWEFPGGKFEASENAFQALQRELQEELGIHITAAYPLINIIHDYGDKAVRLHVLQVQAFEGIAIGLENQPVKWVTPIDLKNYSFPVANKSIIKAINLPSYYPIVDSSLGDENVMLEHLIALIEKGHKFLQLRAKTLSDTDFSRLALKAIAICKPKKVTLFLNTSLDAAVSLGADGVHLNSLNLLAEKKPMENLAIKVAASCHNQADLRKAEKLGVLFAILSPVSKTESHPNADILGWSKFKELTDLAKIPTYALGGLGMGDLDRSRKYGAQGVSGIRKF